MTSRLRGSAKEEPKPTSLLSSKSRTYFSSGWEPREKSGFDGSRNKVSRKDSRGKHDGFPERSEAKYDKETNGYASSPLAEDEDPDLLYRRSRDHFGSWNINDIIGERDAGSKVDRKSRLDLFKSNGVEQQDSRKKLSNGGSRVKHSSADHDDLGDDHPAADNGRKWRGKSRSPDLERDRHKLNKTINLRENHPRPRRERSSINSPDRQDDREGGNRPSHRALLREIENLGTGRRGRESPERSTERRYGGNPSPENRDNDKIRQLIDRFKTNEIQEPVWTGRKSDQGQRSPIGRDNDAKSYHSKVRSSSREKRNEEWQNGGKYQEEHHVDVPSLRSLERRNGTNGDYMDSNDAGYRKRSDTYSLERAGRQRSRNTDEKPKESSGKRRSHVYSGSPEEFDVQIQRYERALPGPRKDPELGRKNSYSGREREPEVRRRSSLKFRDEPTQSQERNGRHTRPLTPPDDRERKFENEKRSPTYNAKDWYESNKQFAAKYLQENSKLGSPDRVNYDQHNNEEEEEYVRRNRSPIKDTYSFGEGRVGYQSEDDQFRERFASPARMEAVESTHERNRGELRTSRKSTRSSIEVDRGLHNGRRTEPVTIKIRNLSEDHHTNEGRSKRGAVLTEATNNGIVRNNRRDDKEDHSPKRGDRDRLDWTSVNTPARKMWNYREGGAKITDIDEGQPCLKCEDACSGFSQHTWRKNCSSCKCPREAHDVCHEEWVSVRSRLGLKGDGAGGSVACDPREMGLAWAPPGLPAHKVEEYFSMLPEKSVPRLGTPGERYRDRQLAMQLPKQDLAKAYCRHLATEHHTSADDFMAARNEIALDIGTVQDVLEKGAKCAGCNESLKYGTVAVSAGKLGEFYHPACFQCVQCRELLVDLAYCVYNDAIYCERHYAELLKGRCAACDELIFSGEFTRAMNKDWHSGHFCCWQCDESLTGQRYVLRDEHPYCIKCYESVFANGCEECSKIIGIDSKDLSYKDKHWHEACFLCNKCRVSLVDKQFGSKVDKIYCGNCYDAQFASRCDGCGEIFRAGTKKMEYKTRQWHEKCFCCVVCKNPIGTKSFIPREQEIYCAGCYEDKFATRCVKCNKIITSGGVTYKNEPWHRECFTCSNCSTSLAGQRFTSRDEKPYCADCFGEIFAKRCTACTKPITGIGGTRFISFEDRHWHNDCFICAGCKTSLVGRGFITVDDDIICPECAKQKLM